MYSKALSYAAFPTAVHTGFVRRVEDLGFNALWLSEGFGREAFTHAAVTLARTTTLQVATGIAVTWARDSTAMANGARTLGEAFPGRFTLGIGVGSAVMVAPRGHEFRSPLAELATYLDRMDEARWYGPEPEVPVARILAALGPRALDLAAARCDGAYTYLVGPAHTTAARLTLGSGKRLVVGMPVYLSDDAVAARAVVKAHLEFYLGIENYRTSLLRQGFTRDDISDVSERLVDGLVATGSVESIRDRVLAHVTAGANTVVIEPLAGDGDLASQLERLAPALVGR